MAQADSKIATGTQEVMKKNELLPQESTYKSQTSSGKENEYRRRSPQPPLETDPNCSPVLGVLCAYREELCWIVTPQFMGLSHWFLYELPTL